MLERKIVLVTGASSGIGRAIALRCARAGADLAITYRKNQAGAEATAREIRALGRRAEIMRTDVSRREEGQSSARCRRRRCAKRSRPE